MKKMSNTLAKYVTAILVILLLAFMFGDCYIPFSFLRPSNIIREGVKEAMTTDEIKQRNKATVKKAKQKEGTKGSYVGYGPGNPAMIEKNKRGIQEIRTKGCTTENMLRIRKGLDRLNQDITQMENFEETKNDALNASEQKD